MTSAMHFLVFVLIFYSLTPNQMLVKGSSKSINNKKQLIVVVLPGESDDHYVDFIEPFADFVTEMDVKTKDTDYLFIIHDESGLKYLKNSGGSRGSQSSHTTKVLFTYKPQYLLEARAKLDRSNFWKFAKMVGLPTLKHVDIIIEGGNIVENGVDAAITTKRMYQDNPNTTRPELVKLLETSIKRNVCVVPDTNDTTGHVDGAVAFVENDVLVIGDYEGYPNYTHHYDLYKNAVLNVFPQLTIVPLPSYAVKDKLYGFDSAEGCYVNALVKNNAVYLPFFANQTSNERAFGVLKNITKKMIVPVYSSQKVSILGGSLRCLTWQIDQDHPVAKHLFSYVEQHGVSSAGAALMSLVAMSVQLSFVLAYFYGSF